MAQLHEIEAFVAVAERGSFAAGARALGVSGPYASKLVARLEERIGQRLLQRTTRRLALTDAGERYLADAQRALGILAASAEGLRDASGPLQGPIRVSAPTGLGLQVLADLFHRFATDHPGVHLTTSYLDRRVDLVAERYDLAVRLGSLPDSSLVARRIATFHRGIVASPEVAATVTHARVPGDLTGVDAVTYEGSEYPERWLLDHDGERATARVRSRLTADNGRAAALGAAAGLGLACLPTFHTRDLEASGRLVRVLPDWRSEVPAQVVFPTGTHLPRRVRALVDFLVAACR